MKMIEWVENKKIKNFKKKIFGFDEKSIKSVLQFHQSLPNYEKTPLIDLKELAKYCGVKKIWVKDESKRFGLNAFKVLGGSYSIGKCLSEILNEDISKLPFSVLTSKEIKKKLGDLTFITATDGNHGRGVAWMAKHLQQKSVVYMPKGSSQMRLKAIQTEGANASITDLNYDDAVRLANKKAKENANIALMRNKKANKVAKKRLKTAEKYLNASQKELFYDEMLSAIWLYISDKLNIPLSSLNKDNAADELRRKGVADDLVSDTIKMLTDCEYERYAFGADKRGAMDKIYNTAITIIERIENSIKR